MCEGDCSSDPLAAVVAREGGNNLPFCPLLVWKNSVFEFASPIAKWIQKTVEGDTDFATTSICSFIAYDLSICVSARNTALVARLIFLLKRTLFVEIIFCIKNGFHSNV